MNKPNANNLFQNKALKKLGFWISEGGDGYGVNVLVYGTGGCHPATANELKMYELLKKRFKKTGKIE